VSAFLTELVCSGFRRGLPLTLREQLIFESDALGCDIVVPAGFETDLASIPRFFWRVLPPLGTYSEPAVVHDWLYSVQSHVRVLADKVLLEGMTVHNVPNWQRCSIYYSVRTFGWAAWNRAKKKRPKISAEYPL
jgi:hypothetical protein